MSTIIAVVNQKGGVGKTTTAVTFGHGLAAAGRRVLVVDLDPQGHVAPTLGLRKAPGLHRWLALGEPLEDVRANARPGLDIVPGDKMTDRVKHYIKETALGELLLARRLREGDYDVILLDCAPSLDVLHIAALIASDYLLVPTRLDHLALDGVNEILVSAAEIGRMGYPVTLAGVLPTFFDRQTRETAEQLRRLSETFGAQVWPPIPTDTKAREAPAYGQTLWEYAPRSQVVLGYQNGSRHRVGGYLAAIERLMEMLA